MENRAHAFAAGLFVVVFSCTAILALWWFAGPRMATRDLVLVTQRSVTGLNPQAQVRFRGIRAGKVLDIALDPKDPANILIVVRVDAALPLTRNTTAQLNYQGITGLAYVMLEDSGKGGEVLPVNDDDPPRILLKPNLLDSLGDRTGEILAHVDEVAIRLNRVLDERNLRNLNRTLENAASASDGLKEIPQLLASLKRAFSDENMQRLRMILSNLERTTGETTPLTVELRALVGSMQSIGKHLDEVVVRAGGELSGSSLPRLNALMSDLQGNSHQLKRVLEVLEASPQSMIFGRPPARPGPGEAGFVNPGK
ncbi:MAG TPA: MlaD family protein [Rhodocyclaceae bacterium]|jgi:phospholipid/cholesterol/gamma-HCH transport system substrate-binding protein|nr:MlaD family protein [Rhodocyclaceae bacterium]